MRADFWDVLSSLVERDAEAFMRFVWGRSSLPSLDPFPVPFRLALFSQVAPDRSPDDYLPVSHTCFFALDMPEYSTREVLREKLLYAIYNCKEMDLA